MEAKAQKSGTKKARNRRKNSFSRPKAISKIILIALAALSLVAAVLYIFLGKTKLNRLLTTALYCRA